MADEIIRILPSPDMEGLDKIIKEQKAYYEKALEVTGIADVNNHVSDSATYYGFMKKAEIDKMIFVFGSNEAGRHGGGAAKHAREHRGAIWGMGYGLMGTSFAIPTKDHRVETLPLIKIRQYVDAFLLFAQAHPNMNFQVTQIGCGLAGLKPQHIAPLFWTSSEDKGENLPNLYFDLAWRPYMRGMTKFWGTF